MEHWVLLRLDNRERRLLEGCISWIQYRESYGEHSFDLGYRDDFVLTEEDERVLADLCEKVSRFVRLQIRRLCTGVALNTGWDCGIWDPVFVRPPGNIPMTLVVDGKLNLRLYYS